MPSGTAPCKAECPAHVPVQGYIKLAAQGRYTEALELIKKENPFPAVCGRICNKACEDACTRGSVDAPIAIDDIKKFIAGKDLEAEHRFVPKMVNQTGKPYEEKIAVIGSRDRLREGKGARRHAHARHSLLPAGKGRHPRRDRYPP